MKSVRKLLLLVMLASTVLFCMGAKPAQAYTSGYGYIFGLGSSPAAIQEVRVYDNTARVYLYGAYVKYYQWTGGFSGLRWQADGMTAGHNYSVRIIPVVNPETDSQIKSQTVPPKTDYWKWPDYDF